jgi:hypothetical protein
MGLWLLMIVPAFVVAFAIGRWWSVLLAGTGWLVFVQVSEAIDPSPVHVEGLRELVLVVGFVASSVAATVGLLVRLIVNPST